MLRLISVALAIFAVIQIVRDYNKTLAHGFAFKFSSLGDAFQGCWTWIKAVLFENAISEALAQNIFPIFLNLPAALSALILAAILFWIGRRKKP